MLLLTGCVRAGDVAVDGFALEDSSLVGSPFDGLGGGDGVRVGMRNEISLVQETTQRNYKKA